MEKARCNTELYSNLRAPLNNVKPSNFWGSHQLKIQSQRFYLSRYLGLFSSDLLSNGVNDIHQDVCNEYEEYSVCKVMTDCQCVHQCYDCDSYK